MLSFAKFMHIYNRVLNEISDTKKVQFTVQTNYYFDMVSGLGHLHKATSFNTPFQQTT